MIFEICLRSCSHSYSNEQNKGSTLNLVSPLPRSGHNLGTVGVHGTGPWHIVALHQHRLWSLTVAVKGWPSTICSCEAATACSKVNRNEFFNRWFCGCVDHHLGVYNMVGIQVCVFIANYYAHMWLYVSVASEQSRESLISMQYVWSIGIWLNIINQYKSSRMGA